MTARPIRYARKRLDADLGDVARAVGACLHPGRSAASAEAGLVALWHPPDAALPCLSARSGLDLLLCCVDWPAGSEVVLSAVTIPHVVRLIREHGYVPVPVDLDPTTMAVGADAVEAACTTRTRAVLVTHLFGASSNTVPVAELTHRRGLMLIEDRAQSYDGVTRALGRADVALYSFGTIKTATSFGGGLLLVADRALLTRIRERQRSYPVQSTYAYLRRLLTVAVLIIVSDPRWYPLLTRVLDLVSGDYDRVIRTVSRGFDDTDLLVQLRHRPSAALLATMTARLRDYEPGRIRRRGLSGEALLRALDDHDRALGARAERRSHWLIAVTADDPPALVAAGRRAGFDLTTGSSTLVAVDPSCPRADRAMTEIVYVPCYPSMPPAAVEALAKVINSFSDRAGADRAGADRSSRDRSFDGAHRPPRRRPTARSAQETH